MLKAKEESIMETISLAIQSCIGLIFAILSTITASLINLTNSTPQNGHLSTQPKNPARYPLDPLAQQAKSVLIPIVQKGKSTLSITYRCRYVGVCRLFFCTFKHRYALDMCCLWELIDW